MRLWHYELVRVLPNQQLVSQWRELCAISARIEKRGYPNHLLVNKVMDYSHIELIEYSNRVIEEMNYRNFKINMKKYDDFIQNLYKNKNKFKNIKKSYLGQYIGWHTEKYYYQCYYNLEEKHDCGGISDDEWFKIQMNEHHFRLRICLYNRNY